MIIVLLTVLCSNMQNEETKKIQNHNKKHEGKWLLHIALHIKLTATLSKAPQSVKRKQTAHFPWQMDVFFPLQVKWSKLQFCFSSPLLCWSVCLWRTGCLFSSAVEPDRPRGPAAALLMIKSLQDNREFLHYHTLHIQTRSTLASGIKLQSFGSLCLITVHKRLLD